MDNIVKTHVERKNKKKEIHKKDKTYSFFVDNFINELAFAKLVIFRNVAVYKLLVST